MAMIGYMVLVAETPEKLSQLVTSKLEANSRWMLHGQVVISSVHKGFGTVHTTYAQTLVKYGSPK